jgi:hypothetical protein
MLGTSFLGQKTNTFEIDKVRMVSAKQASNLYMDSRLFHYGWEYEKLTMGFVIILLPLSHF